MEIMIGDFLILFILNSLQMGFKTLAIEKRSVEVWQIIPDLIKAGKRVLIEHTPTLFQLNG